MNGHIFLQITFVQFCGAEAGRNRSEGQAPGSNLDKTEEIRNYIFFDCSNID